MGFWRQFDNFDPLTGEVPFWPYSSLSGITWRARNLLRKRTSKQIHILAETMNQWIENYFDQAKDDEISRLKNEGLYDFLESDEEGAHWSISSERVNELDFPTPDNTSDLDALSECVGSWSDIFDDGSPDPENHEYFAVLALCKVADSIYKIEFKYDFKNNQHVKKDRKKLDPYDFTSAGEYAVYAMEAVCHAEQLRDGVRIKARFEERLEAEKKHSSAKVLKANEANEAKWKALQAEEAKQKSEHARKMAALSKKNRNESMAAVLAEWDKQPVLQKLSNAKAGVRLSEWLAGQDLEFFEPRTVSLWISDHKKSQTNP